MPGGGDGGAGVGEGGGPSFPRLKDLEALSREEATGEAGRAGQYTIRVTNTGLVDADDVVLGFIEPPGAGTGGLPVKELFGFERVHVKAGETVVVTLYPPISHLAATAADGRRYALPGKYVKKSLVCTHHIIPCIHPLYTFITI